MTDTNSHDLRQPWHHAPTHQFVSGCAYIVTASTYERLALFDTGEKRDSFLAILFHEVERFGWRLEAWAVMANHYHIVAIAPEDASTLTNLLRTLHSKSAVRLNHTDGTPGRKVWHQYWDTCITNRESFLARLKYVHRNPEKHGLVSRAEEYPWCSAGWFEQEATPSFQRTLASFGIDRVNVPDDF